MKITILPFLALSLSSLLLISCANDKNSRSSGAGEPNNSILTAATVEAGKSFQMKIDSVGDVDWFALPVKDSGYVEVASKNVPDNLKLNIRFAQREEWNSQKEKWLSNWMNLPIAIPISGIDTLYFAIVDDYNDAFSEDSFEIKADFIDEFDKYEPNDTPEQAREIKTGEIVESAFFPKSDRDWFKIKVDSAGYLMLKARKVPEEININVRYSYKASEFDKVEPIEGWKSLPAGIHVGKPGMYYIELVDDYNDAMSREFAEWKLDYIPQMDITEPNNSIEEAHAVNIGDTVEHYIFPVKDVDFFTFTTATDQKIQIMAKTPAGININVRLHVEQDMKTSPEGSWKSLPTTFELRAGKKYFLEVVDDYNDAYSEEAIKLTIQKAEM